MFTNNYLNWRKAMFVGGSLSLVGTDGATLAKTPTVQYAYSGDIGFVCIPRIYSIPGQPSEWTSTCQPGTQGLPGTYFGSGITPATVDDYTLESPITSGLSASSGGAALWKENDGLYVYEQRYLLTNTSDANITINEIGQIRTVVYSETTAKYWHSPVLMDRTVLDEPIYIAPGETRLVTYRINFNQTLV